MAAVVSARRGDVFLIGLDPVRGDEIRKTSPCLIVSPGELNQNLRTFMWPLERE
ncbi:MAG: type II toxin-antitoxin system PemK/MazF family toxin [Syntrophobacteraceae bacterium]